MQLARRAYLFVLPWSLKHLGGVNQVVINLGLEMQRAGIFEPVVLITDWNATVPVWEEMHGLKTVRWRIRPYHQSMNFKEKVAYWVWENSFRSAFQEFCSEYRVAAINPHFVDSSSMTLDRMNRFMTKPVPLILSFHGADINSYFGASADEIAAWQRLLQCADGIVVCSNDLGNRVRDVFGDDLITTVVHNGLDVDGFVAKAHKRIRSDRRVILNVGKFEVKKGQDVLIKAFAKIASDYPDVDLVLVGATDSALPILKDLCVYERIVERVRFCADIPHDQVANFFKQATIFALPSRQEPFGIVILEAGAFALPVVATRVGGIPEILTDGYTGRLVSPDDPVELAECLRSLLDKPSESEAMAARLHNRVVSDFTWTVAYEKYKSMIASS